jgi:hypothetical protein
VKAQAILVIARDIGCLIIGLAGVAHQEITGKTNLELLIVYMTLLGVPGAISLLQLSRGKEEISGTHDSSSSSQSLPSSQEH